MENLVVIGAGQSAIQCITSLKKEGYEGSITLVGEEEHLPYQRPPLSKGFLDDSINKERLYFKKLDFFTENKIQLKLGISATSVDIENNLVNLSDEEKLHFDKLVIATGSRVRLLDFPGNDLDNIHYLRGLDDAENIKKGLEKSKHLVVIGAGYIGLEVAAIASEKGVKVSIVEMADRVMSRTVDPQISDYYLNLHQNNGVKFKFNTSLEEIKGQGQVESVMCSDGTSINADMVIIGAGVIPNTEIAQNSGVSCENGILVDEFGRTNFKNVFACGDCTSHPNKLLNMQLRLESVHNAMEQSKAAAMSVLDKPAEYSQIPWFWSDQYDHKLQIVGISGSHDTVTMRGSTDASKFMLFYTRGEELVAVDAVNNPKDFLICRKLVANKVKIKTDMISDLNLNLNDLI